MRPANIIFLTVLFVSAIFPLFSNGENLTDELGAGQQVTVCSAGITQYGTARAKSLGEQSADFFTSILDTQSWPARWNCGIWSPFHGWLYIVSDIIIWISYFMIPLILGFFVYKKKQEPIPFKMVVFLFIAFILACGLTHLVDAAIFWWPVYKLSALVRMVTATVSLGTVFALINITPRVLELKSPEVLEGMVKERTAELHELNLRLQKEIKNRQEAEERLRQLNKELEEKSKGLTKINEQLLLRESELKKSEEQIRELNIDLEIKVERRTQELDATNKELEAFTYSVSHDVRAPLRSISGFTKILRQEYGHVLDAEGLRLLGIVQKNGKKMGNLIDDLLAFSRLGRKDIQKTKIDMHALMLDSWSELKKSTDHTAEIKLNELHPALADASLVQQVVINLLSNAVKYSSKKINPVIEVKSERKDNEIIYSVMDNGVGFDMQYYAKLFGVFQRLHSSTDFEGTGVGLAIVHRIITKHGGRVWAEGKLNEGAAFHFSLPVDL
jgi:signal transduction histidine kinase